MCPHSMARKDGFVYYEDNDTAYGKPCPPPFVYLTEESDETNFQLSFPNKSVSDYVRFDLQSGAPPLTVFTLCLWIKVGDQSDDGALFSYSLPGEDNEILVIDYSSLKLTINDAELRRVEKAVNDDQWHHICTTWENSAGNWTFYIDGTCVAKGDNVEAGHVISSDGIVILGQDQDTFGGGFERSQSFFGEMYGVNMWNVVLSAEEILHMSKNCFYGVGNYLKWSDFVAGLYGNVIVKSPTTCLP